MEKVIDLNGQKIFYDPDLTTFKLYHGDSDPLFLTSESSWPKMFYSLHKTRKEIRIPCVFPQDRKRAIVAIFDFTSIFWSTIQSNRSLQGLFNGKTFLTCQNYQSSAMLRKGETLSNQGVLEGVTSDKRDSKKLRIIPMSDEDVSKIMTHEKRCLNEYEAVDKASQPEKITAIECPDINDIKLHDGDIIFGIWKVKARLRVDALTVVEAQKMAAFEQISTTKLNGQKPEAKSAEQANSKQPPATKTPCQICGWYHDGDDLTSFRDSNRRYTFSRETNAHKVLRHIHKEMESGSIDANYDSQTTDDLLSAFKTKKGSYKALIELRGPRRARIKRPEETTISYIKPPSGKKPAKNRRSFLTNFPLLSYFFY